MSSRILNSKRITPATQKYHESYVANAGQLTFTLNNAYVLNSNALEVYVNGVRETAITEVDTKTVSLPEALKLGDTVDFYITVAATLGSMMASNVQYNSSRSVGDKLNDWISVKDYGAKGDGTTDDTTAIQNALNASGIVLFPAGTYIHTGLTIPAYTKVIGASRDKTVLKNTNNAHGVTMQSVMSCNIEDITIDQTGNTNSVDCLYIIDTSNCYFKNLGITAPGRRGISLNAGLNSGVYNNTFVEVSITSLTGSNVGIYLGNASGSTANNGNKFIGGRVNNGSYGIYLDTLAGLANEFNLTVQDQTVAACHIDAAQNVFMGYYELNQSGAVIFQLTNNAESCIIMPFVQSANGGSTVLSQPNNSPNTANPQYTYIPPAGSGVNARLENLAINKLYSDVGSGLGVASPNLMLSRSVNPGGNSGSTETTVITYSLPGNSLDSGGVGLRIKAWGSTVNNANAKSFKLYVGGVNMAGGSVPANGANPWRVEFVMYRTNSNTYEYYVEQVVTGNTTVYQYVGSQTNTDLTSAVAISLSLTGVASSDISCNGFSVEYLP